MIYDNLKNFIFGSTHYFTIFLAAVVIIFTLTIFRPFLASIKTISSAVEKERYELEKLYTRGQVVHQVKIKLEDAKKDLPILESTVPKKGTELVWIEKLEKIASGYNLKQRLDLGSGKSEDDFEVLAFNMELKGDFRDILSYLRELERMEGYINILSFEVGNAGESQSGANGRDALSGQGQVTALLKVDTFWQK